MLSDILAAAKLLVNDVFSELINAIIQDAMLSLQFNHITKRLQSLSNVKKMNSRILFALKNYRMALIAALFFGSIAPCAKLLSKTIPPQSMAGLFYFTAGVGLLLILIFLGKVKESFARIQKKDLRYLVFSTIFGGLLGPVFLTYGLGQLSGSTASLLLNLEAVLTSLIAWVIFKEHFDRRIVYGMILIVCGCLVLTANFKASGSGDSLFGNVLIFLACLAWGIDNNVTRIISHLNPLLIACIKGLVAGSVNLLIGFFLGERLAADSSLLQAGILGFLGIGISLVAFISSLGTIGTARTGAIFSTAPFLGASISIIFLGDPITLPFTMALLLMVGGLWLHLSEHHLHEHTHDPITHVHEHSHDEHHQHLHSSCDPSQEPHVHEHSHGKLRHNHPHFPDIHHQHQHKREPEQA